MGIFRFEKVFKQEGGCSGGENSDFHKINSVSL